MNFLKELDEKKVIYSEKTVPEIYAALRTINGENYYILTSALIPTENPNWNILNIF
jgi:hypothetical protein